MVLKNFVFAASAVLVTGVLTSGPASAACRQVFTNTTCTGGGWMQPKQVCTNHFKTVCDEARPAIQTRLAPNHQPPKPVIAPNSGGRLIGNDSAGVISRDGAGLIGNDGGSFKK